MENQEIQNIKNRIAELLSEQGKQVSTSSSENDFAFENSIGLLKEQYLELELGLKQIATSEYSEAREFLKKVRAL